MARNISLPDGRTLTLTGQETPEQLGALKQKLSQKFKQPEPVQAIQEPVEQRTFGEQAARTAGRGARNIAAGLSAIADVGLLLPKTLASGVELGLETAGLEGSALETFAERVRTTPALREQVVGGIDTITKGTLQPEGKVEAITDFIIEAAVPSGGISKVKDLKDAPKAIQALQSALDVQGAAARKVAGKQIVPNSEQLRKQAGRLYQQADEVGGVLTPEFTDDFIKEINKLTPQTEIGQKITGESAFSRVIERFNSIRGEPINLRAAQELDEFLGDEIDKLTELGKLKKEGRKIFEIQSTLRNMIENAETGKVAGGKEGFEALKEGRKLWSTSRKLSDIERIIERADLTDNPASAIKSGFRTLLNNPNRIKGFNKTEREAIKKAAQTGVVTDLFRTFGSRLISIVSVASGAGVGGTAAATAASLASRGAATKLQVGKANRLADLIATQGGSAVKPIRQISPRTVQAATGISTIATSRAQSKE